MKYRLTFVTNSSSASYVVLKKGVSEAQIVLLLDPTPLKNKKPTWFKYDGPGSWSVNDHKDSVHFWTSMDNFDYTEVFDFLGIPDENISGENDG